jgi:hypothetical protein
MGKPAYAIRFPKFRPPRRRDRRTEGSVEESCRKYAHDRGWTSRKMNGMGFRSWPDRFFLPPARAGRQAYQLQLKRRFWVEFKRPSEEPTPDQARMHRDLRARGETVYVLSDRPSFIRVFESHCG